MNEAQIFQLAKKLAMLNLRIPNRLPLSVSASR